MPGAGAGAAGLALGGAGGFVAGRESAGNDAAGTGSVPFYGAHQAGIDTAAQDRLHFRSALEDQEQTIGRRKYSGAALGESAENDPLDLEATRDGEPAIPADAHVRLTSPRFNDGERILRRGYSFTDGVDERWASSKPGSSSSASSATRAASSSRSSAGWGRTTPWASTSSTSAAPSSRSPQALTEAATSAKPSSAD